MQLNLHRLRHPYAVHERVPPVINLLTIRSWWDFHNSTLGLILGLAITGAITQFTKITVGRPRPVSFAGLGFLAFYLAGKLHLFDRRGHAIIGKMSLWDRLLARPFLSSPTASTIQASLLSSHIAHTLHASSEKVAGTVERPDLPLTDLWADGADQLSAPRSTTPAK
ncbi:hypothetical protein H0H93_007218 [Arthromyces matolae]|nr:hypothetical protein H0H93_007218 [Arthromyces matolae]